MEHLISRRYMWKVKGSDFVDFRIITDLPQGHVDFIKHVSDTVEDLERFGYEYICEYDVEQIAKIESIRVDFSNTVEQATVAGIPVDLSDSEER